MYQNIERMFGAVMRTAILKAINSISIESQANESRL